MSKAETNALLLIGAVFVVGFLLVRSRNQTARKLGRRLEGDAEDWLLNELI
jgi:hypothetical protein